MAVGANNLNGAALRELILHDEHFHNRQWVAGLRAPQTATEWADFDTFSPYLITSAAGSMGSEIQLIGTGDLPFYTGMTVYDPGAVFVSVLNDDTPYRFRLVYGSGTFADAVTAKQFTETAIQNVVSGNKANGSTIRIPCPRLTIGTDKLWATIANAGVKTASVFVAGHEYPE